MEIGIVAIQTMVAKDMVEEVMVNVGAIASKERQQLLSITMLHMCTCRSPPPWIISTNHMIPMMKMMMRLLSPHLMLPI